MWGGSTGMLRAVLAFTFFVCAWTQECNDWCRDECPNLNGDFRYECGGCVQEQGLRCFPGAPGWDLGTVQSVVAPDGSTETAEVPPRSGFQDSGARPSDDDASLSSWESVQNEQLREAAVSSLGSDELGCENFTSGLLYDAGCNDQQALRLAVCDPRPLADLVRWKWAPAHVRCRLRGMRIAGDELAGAAATEAVAAQLGDACHFTVRLGMGTCVSVRVSIKGIWA